MRKMNNQSFIFKIRVKLLLIFCVLFTISFSCTTPKVASGYYISKFAEGGFFITELSLKTDNTFFWRMYGDTRSDSASGTYKLDGSTISLFYNPVYIVPDSFQLSYLKEHNLPLSTLEPLKLSRPKYFKATNNRLYVIDSTGQLKKTVWNHIAGKRMKYYLIRQ
jgi:hypothetical protein